MFHYEQTSCAHVWHAYTPIIIFFVKGLKYQLSNIWDFLPNLMRLISFSTLCSPIWSKTRALKLSKHVMGTNEKTLLGGPPHLVLPRAPTSLNPPLHSTSTSINLNSIWLWHQSNPILFWFYNQPKCLSRWFKHNISYFYKQNYCKDKWIFM